MLRSSSSNGLLCVSIDESDSSHVSDMTTSSLFLWNPAIGEVRQIPRPRTTTLPEWDCTVGFGFSAIVNDYKIVKTYAWCDDVVSRVEMYSLVTGSWKGIDFGSLEDLCLLGHPVTANGAIFWYGERLFVEEGEDYNDLIVSFDIAMEVFTLIPRAPLSNNSSSKFTVYEDKFAILSLSRIGDFPNYLYSSIDLWVLEEDIAIGSSKERWSWTKKYTRYPCPSMLNLGTIWKNEIVCVDPGMLKGYE